MSPNDPLETLGTAFAERSLWNTSRGHSGLMLAARITLPHFSVSSAISLPKSAGEPASTVPPRSARPALISFLSLSMISMAVFLGAPRPNEALAAAQAHKRHLRAVL
jgi:hypothetical protein